MGWSMFIEKMNYPIKNLPYNHLLTLFDLVII
jgi:hypothetical protein